MKDAPVIYVVEDSPELLELAGLALAKGPWKVKQFGDPKRALRSFKADQPKPALVLTDYSMGDMTGLELAACCKEMHPATKVILMSGTASGEILKDATCQLEGFLPKPFRPGALAGLVKSVLEE